MRESWFAVAITLALTLAMPLAAPANDVWYGSFVSTDVTLTRDLIGVNSIFDGLRVVAHNITIDGNGYALERQGDLTDPAPWQTLGEAEYGTGAPLEIPDASPYVSRRFYRIRVALRE